MAPLLRTYSRVYRSTKRRVTCGVGPSLLPRAGLGLFAPKGARVGQQLCTYEGARVTRQELRGVTSDYLWFPDSAETGVDASDPSSCLGRYINDVLDEHSTNCRVVRKGAGYVVVALRDIEPEEELYMSYGGDYWAPRLRTLDAQTMAACMDRYRLVHVCPPPLGGFSLRRLNGAGAPKALEVGISRQAGGCWGLFASAGWKRGAVMDQYRGSRRSRAEVSRDDYHSDYVLCDMFSDRAVDADGLADCYARYANDGFGRANAELLWGLSNDWPTLRALTDIGCHEEILVAYGAEYWCGSRLRALPEDARERCCQHYSLPYPVPLSPPPVLPPAALDVDATAMDAVDPPAVGGGQVGGPGVRSHRDLVHVTGLSEAGRVRVSLAGGVDRVAIEMWKEIRDRPLDCGLALFLGEWMQRHRHRLRLRVSCLQTALPHDPAACASDGTCAFLLLGMLEGVRDPSRGGERPLVGGGRRVGVGDLVGTRQGGRVDGLMEEGGTVGTPAGPVDGWHPRPYGDLGVLGVYLRDRKEALGPPFALARKIDGALRHWDGGSRGDRGPIPVGDYVSPQELVTLGSSD